MTLFVEQERVWSYEEFDIEPQILADFGTFSDGKFSFLSVSEMCGRDIFWQVSDEDDLIKVILYSSSDKNNYVRDVSYLVNNTGKESIFFLLYSEESEFYETYYLEKS